ncbi:MAG: hypothetical protein ACTHJ4_02130, partial [Candidatus Nucleicultricaceae bacterium]
MKFCWYYFRHFLISGATFSLLSVSSSFASGMSKEIEKMELMDEENDQNDRNITEPLQLPNRPRIQHKVRKKRCHTVHPDMLEPFALNFPISVQDITRALEQLKLMEDGNMQEKDVLLDFSTPMVTTTVHPDMPDLVSPSSQMSAHDVSVGLEKLKLAVDKGEEGVKFLDFTKPISSTQLFFDFGELPRKLKKHITKFAYLYLPEHRAVIGEFVEKVEYYAKENLLLRAENAGLIDDLRELPKDYEMISLYEQTEDFHNQAEDLQKQAEDLRKKNAYLTHITLLHNDLSSGIAPRGSRFRNQWLAFEVMKEEAWDYIQMGYEKFSETEQKGSKVIHLTIDMVIPFYTFLKDNMTLIAALENEREAFYHLLHRHGGITKKTVQFEQAIDEFPSYIGRLREAADEAEKREAAELAQQAAL